MDLKRVLSVLFAVFVGVAAECSDCNFLSPQWSYAAVNGDTSADLLALLPTIDKEVKEADLIVVTIGGNDMLGIIWNAADAIGGVTGDIYSKINDPVYTAKFLEQINAESKGNSAD